MGDLGPQVIVAAALLLVGVGVGLLLLARRYRQGDGSGALIVTSSAGPRVTFTGALVLSTPPRSVVGRLDSAELDARREELPDELAAAVGDDLHGFVLDEVKVDTIEPPPSTARRDPTDACDLRLPAAEAAPAALNPEG